MCKELTCDNCWKKTEKLFYINGKWYVCDSCRNTYDIWVLLLFIIANGLLLSWFYLLIGIL